MNSTLWWTLVIGFLLLVGGCLVSAFLIAKSGRKLMNRWFPYRDMYDTKTFNPDKVELHRPPTLDEITPQSPFVSGIEDQIRASTTWALGKLIGCTDEEIERTIQAHIRLAATTPYRLDWNRVRDDLLKLRFPDPQTAEYADGMLHRLADQRGVEVDQLWNSFVKKGNVDGDSDV